jgi:hypothetical protein
MRDFNIGLVCEGKTDFEIIEQSLKASLVSDELQLNFDFIQPAKDATSGSFGEGGWRRVYQWCTRNQPQDRRKYFRGEQLFESSDTGVDLIIIHLDGDVADIPDVRNITPIEEAEKINLNLLNALDRHKYVSNIIDIWLKQSDDTSEYKEKYIPLVPIICSEAWLLALCDSQDNVESRMEAKLEAQKLWYSKKGKKIPENFSKLKNPFEKYSEIYELSEFNVEKLEECLAFKKTKQLLEKALG